MGFTSAILEVIKEAGVSLGMDVLFEKLKKEGSKEVAERITKKITDERRAELLTFIRELAAHDIDPIASETLFRRQHDRQNGNELSYKPGTRYPAGSEDEFVTLLTKLYVSLGDNEEEKSSRVEMFKWLGRITDEEFDAMLEFLKHDVVMQYIRKIPHAIESTYAELKDLSKHLKTNESIQELDAFGAKKAREFRKFLNSKGVKR